MATSGSSDFTVNRDQILESAYRIINVISAGDSLTSDQVTEGSRQLNMMCKTWQSEGLNLWVAQEATMWMVKDQVSYNLPGANATSSFTQTAIKVAASDTDTTIDVDSTSGMTAGDFIGLTMDDATIHWSTIASVTDSDTVVIDDAIDDDAAVDNKVFFYTTKIGRPLRVISARRRETGDIDIPIRMVSRREYNEQSDKTNSASVVEAWYDRQLTTGVLYVWKPTDTESTQLKLTLQRKIEDFDTSTDNADYPSEWEEALVWNLAVKLGIRNGVSDKIMAQVRAEAMQTKGSAKDFDREDASFSIQFDVYGENYGS